MSPSLETSTLFGNEIFCAFTSIYFIVVPSCLALSTQQLSKSRIHGLSKLDNWGWAHIHIFAFCTINFFRDRLFLWRVDTNI